MGCCDELLRLLQAKLVAKGHPCAKGEARHLQIQIVSKVGELAGGHRLAAAYKFSATRGLLPSPTARDPRFTLSPVRPSRLYSIFVELRSPECGASGERPSVLSQIGRRIDWNLLINGARQTGRRQGSARAKRMPVPLRYCWLPKMHLNWGEQALKCSPRPPKS